MAVLQILDHTDPVCPFAWSAEPTRRRIAWLYGEAIRSRPRMVGLHADAEEMRGQGLTPERLAAGQSRLAHAHHMPMQTTPHRLVGSIPACRAVIAARLIDPARERAMLRALRVANFAGELVDEPATLRAAATTAGIDPDELQRRLADPQTDRVLEEEMAAARAPSAAARALPGKLAGTDDGGLRYTCPSWEISCGERTLTVPGFQPTAVYEVAIANLAPQLSRREDPQGVGEVLRWAGEPLATAEVAAVCAIELDDAREQLGHVARERHVGFDGLWSL